MDTWINTWGGLRNTRLSWWWSNPISWWSTTQFLRQNTQSFNTTTEDHRAQSSPDCPPQSPDLNHIQHSWGHLKTEKDHQFVTTRSFVDTVRSCWDESAGFTLTCGVYAAGVHTVIKSKWGQTKDKDILTFINIFHPKFNLSLKLLRWYCHLYFFINAEVQVCWQVVSDFWSPVHIIMCDKKKQGPVLHKDITCHAVHVSTHRVDWLAAGPGHHSGDEDEHLRSRKMAYIIMEG